MLTNFNKRQINIEFFHSERGSILGRQVADFIMHNLPFALTTKDGNGEVVIYSIQHLIKFNLERQLMKFNSLNEMYADIGLAIMLYDNVVPVSRLELNGKNKFLFTT